MNKKQRNTIFTGLIIIAAAFIVWAFFGFELFTKTEVLIEKQDELFGTTFKEWEDKFIWGLDYTLYVTGITVLICTVLYFVFKNKNKASDEIS